MYKNIQTNYCVSQSIEVLKQWTPPKKGISPDSQTERKKNPHPEGEIVF